MRPPTPAENLATVEQYVEAVDRAIRDALENILTAVRALEGATVSALAEVVADLAYTVEHELDGITGSLPCAEGVSSYLDACSGAAFDPVAAAGEILHELEGRRANTAPAEVLAWVSATLEILARAEDAEAAAAELPEALRMVAA